MDYYYFLILILLLIVALSSRSRGDSVTQDVLTHMNFRERLVFYGMAAGLGISIPILGAIIAGVVMLICPHFSALLSLTIVFIALFPISVLAVVYLRDPIKQRQKQFLTKTKWAREKSITENQINF